MHGGAFAGSLGAVFLMLVPAALSGRLRRPVALAGLFALAYVLLWASPVSSQQIRFLLPVAPMLALLAGIGFDRAWRLAHGAHPALAGVLAVVVVGVLALSLPPFTGMHEREGAFTLAHVLRSAPLDVVSGAEGEREYLTRTIPAYGAARALDGAGGPVVAFTDPYVDFYAEPELIPDYSACLRIAGARPPDVLSERRALGQLGIRRLLLQRDRRADQAGLELTRGTPPADVARAIYEDRRAVVYELRPAR
jgi:hypothetical protein